MEVPTEAALNRMTVIELKDMAKVQGLQVKEKILKKNLVEIVRSNSVKLAEAASPVKKGSSNSKAAAAVVTPKAVNSPAVVPPDVEEESNEQSVRKYTEMMTDAFGYISPQTVRSEFQRHYRAVTWVIAIEALAMIVCPFPQTSEELQKYDPVVDKLNLPAFRQAATHWFVFLIILPVVVAAVMADRNAGSAYATLLFAMTRYLIVYLEIPVTATVFNFLPIKLFTSVCGGLSVLSFWSHVSFDDIGPADIDDLDWLNEEEPDDEED